MRWMIVAVTLPTVAVAFTLPWGAPTNIKGVRTVTTKLWASSSSSAQTAPLVDQVGSTVETVLDTVEDVVTHGKRFQGEPPQKKKDRPPGREALVILGSGWAAHALLKVIDAEKYEVLVVSPVNHFAFTPMLAAAAVGTVEYRSMTETVRRANPFVEYVEGAAVDVDPVAQTVTVALAAENMSNGGANDHENNDQEVFAYDRLVVACGVRVNDGVVPGASEHCYRLKECEDAVRLRAAIGRRFEQANRVTDDPEERRRLLTFVVVGGGPTGVELAGELCDYIRDVTRNFPRLGGPAAATVVLAHSGAELLQQFDAPQRAEALRVLRAQGVEVLLRTRVQTVSATAMDLSSTGGKEATTLPYGVAVWCAGTAPQPFVATLLDRLPRASAAGRLVAVDEWLRVRGLGDDDDAHDDHGGGSAADVPKARRIARGSILALGDAARVVDARTGAPVALPQTAQVAAQQGAFLARFLNRAYDYEATPPVLRDDAYADQPLDRAWIKLVRRAAVAPKFAFTNLGMLAYLGRGKALAEVKIGDTPLGAYTGDVGYLLWKSVYLVKQVATRNRVLVTFDWLKTALFGRDITRL